MNFRIGSVLRNKSTNSIVYISGVTEENGKNFLALKGVDHIRDYKMSQEQVKQDFKQVR